MRQTMLKRFLSFFLALLFLLLLSAASLAESPIPDLTLEDLQAMNDGALVYSTNDDGYITFLRGRYYDGKIESLEDVRKALSGVALLLGADKSSTFSPGTVVTDDNGYHYHTYFQWQGDASVKNSIVKLITDADNNPVALSSSVTPGVPGNLEALISPKEALAAVKAHLAESAPDTAYTFYEDTIDSYTITSVDDEDTFIANFVFVVYTNNPAADVRANSLFYLAHYVSAEGEYMYSIPVAAIGDSSAKAGAAAEQTFVGMTPAEYTGSVTDSKGETRELTVPVMLDESTGTYYLGDIERKILVADCWEFEQNDHHVVAESTPDNTGWPDAALLSYSNYIRLYDFSYVAGWPSVDGLGTPILLLADYVDAEHKPVDNACYMGLMAGWHAFAATSELNHFNEALDVIGHEYTHGFTSAIMTTILYENQYGAINESMSDIMGNLVEMLYNGTNDTKWQMGETVGTPVRSMTDPNAHGQPAYVGDKFYTPDVLVPTEANDRGGVHMGNSLLSGVAPKLYEAGMSLEEERRLWVTFACSLTPRSGYRDAALMLPFAAEIAGLGQWQEAVAAAISEIGLDNDEPFATMQEGCGMVTMKLLEKFDPSTVRLNLIEPETQMRIMTWPGKNTDQMLVQMPEGVYVCLFQVVLDENTMKSATYAFDGERWGLYGEVKNAGVTVKAGETLELPTDGL